MAIKIEIKTCLFHCHKIKCRPFVCTYVFVAFFDYSIQGIDFPKFAIYRLHRLCDTQLCQLTFYYAFNALKIVRTTRLTAVPHAAWHSRDFINYVGHSFTFKVVDFEQQTQGAAVK